MYKLLTPILLLTFFLMLSACGANSDSPGETGTEPPIETEETTAPIEEEEPAEIERDEIDADLYTLSGVTTSQKYITAKDAEITLDNAEIICADGSALVAGDGNESITLKLVGANYITSTAADAIVGAENFTITGDGSLYVKADNGAGKAITVLGTLTFEHNGGEVIFESLSNEAVEAEKIYLKSGNVVALGGEDGVNASSDRSDELTTCEVNISGGRLTVYSKSDGIDSNGTITISGGEVAVLINAPTDGDPLDADGTITITPGVFIYENIGAGDGKLGIRDAEGAYTWIGDLPGDMTSGFITSPEFKDGEEYSVYSGDTEISAVTASTEIQNARQGAPMTEGARPAGGERGRGGNNVQVIPDPTTGGSIVISPGGVTEVAPGETIQRPNGGGANPANPGAGAR